MKVLSVSFIGLLIFSSFDCRENPVGPPSGSDTNSSAFTWTVDTIGVQGSVLCFGFIAGDILVTALEKPLLLAMNRSIHDEPTPKRWNTNHANIEIFL